MVPSCDSISPPTFSGHAWLSSSLILAHLRPYSPIAAPVSRFPPQPVMGHTSSSIPIRPIRLQGLVDQKRRRVIGPSRPNCLVQRSLLLHTSISSSLTIPRLRLSFFSTYPIALPKSPSSMASVLKKPSGPVLRPLTPSSDPHALGLRSRQLATGNLNYHSTSLRNMVSNTVNKTALHPAGVQ